jgi:uncharacterized protein (DUF1778 family)
MKKRINFRADIDDITDIRIAAKIEKRTLSSFLIYSSLERAKRIIQEHKQKVVSCENNINMQH